MSDLSRASSMTAREIAALLTAYEGLRRENEELKNSNQDLTRQVEWFRRQLFGAKSERRIVDADATQLTLGGLLRAEAAARPAVEVGAHRRRRNVPEERPAEEALRFDPSVPVEEIEVPNPELEGADLAAYDLVGEKVTERLAQRPGAYVVLRYRRKVYKRREDGAFTCPPAPPAVLERGLADASFLAGLVIDKFRFHLPLYRQHQRLELAGVHLGRSTLTSLVHRVAGLLEPVYEAQLRSILSSQVLAMDETPIKAGRKDRPPPHRGTMRTAYFWPIYGDRHEICFPFANTRAGAVVKEALRSYVGVLLSDGYRVYDVYAKANAGVVHAQCWNHARRTFEEAEPTDPGRIGQALNFIGLLYQHEAAMRSHAWPPEKVLAYRTEHMRPVVDQFFQFLHDELQSAALLPSNRFRHAAQYALRREPALRVFLERPEVPIDTNHLERSIRPIAVGRKNWMFCWTEVGAKYVGVLQSLLVTCQLHGIDPYTYLVDVLQRIDTHPARDVELLTPRRWKETFAANPLRSALDRK